ncbi:basic amino acid ABC transporter substrate-binding protein [Uruburuella testudinis]|uniref:Basic amino acid ABC transporter substrate-binding protein n=1 Tax=Uruburuella testudinis TaxID=1282863 RepID=A0ABY4DWD7_9NEIS|nr:basic amino acid ABC transporter substrate-binding protein [Uruburuella testudinis]UOO82965.1 basic amino acid ABC transporter substrate-binding protein [Uruburuella testudinis]
MFVKPTALLATLSAALMLAACQPAAQSGNHAADHTNKVYNVGMNANFAPFESTDSQGRVHGFDVDLMDAMAKAGGFNIQYKNQPWDGLFASLKSKDNDILISAITITDERRQSMAFSKPYFEVKQVVLVSNGQNIRSVNDLAKLDKIAVSTGTTGDYAAQKLFGTTSPKIARFENLPLTVKALETGGAQAMISDSAVVGNYVKNNGNSHFTVIEVPDFPVEEYGIAVRPDETELLATLNASLQKVRDSGEYETIYRKYFAQ